MSARIQKWAIELTKFDILYIFLIVVKFQVLTDFVIEFAIGGPSPLKVEAHEDSYPKAWHLFVNDVASYQYLVVSVVLKNETWKVLFSCM